MEGKKPVVEHAGETTAKHRRELIQTALLADKLKANRGQLLDAENVRARLGMALAEHGRWLDGLPDVLVRDGGLPDEITPQLRHAIDVERAKFFGAMKAALSVA